MHCERARHALLDRLDGPLDGDAAADLSRHLEGCTDCRSLQQDLHDQQSQARLWHELSPPPWNPDLPGVPRPPTAAGGWPARLRLWLPSLASGTALLLVALMYWQNGPATAADPPVASATATTAAGGGPVRTPSAIEHLLATTRAERQRELEALTALLTAEMDRRSLETEQSLKYVISHQIHSQRQLESLRGQLGAAGSPGGPAVRAAPEQL